MTEFPNAAARIAAVFDALGIPQAHIGWGSMSMEIPQLAAERHDLIASMAMCVPLGAPPPVLNGPWPMFALFGRDSGGMASKVRAELLQRDKFDHQDLPESYAADFWNDIVADHVESMASGVRRLAETVPLTSVALAAGEQEIAGVRVRIAGEGPPLVLLPAGYYPSQWDALVDRLMDEFTVIRLSGAHLGSIAGLANRAATPGYGRLVDGLFDRLAIREGETIVEVGAGPGSVARRLAERLPSGAKIVATDVNRFFVDEGAAITRQQMPDAPIEWRYASAESLSFADGSIDVIYSVTVFEECDADRAIEEMHRVLRPGGRAGIIVRAEDRPRYWNLDVGPPLEKVLRDNRGPVGAGGCGDRSLFARVARHFNLLDPYVDSFTSAPPFPPMVQFVMNAIDASLRDELQEAVDEGIRAGTAFISLPMHCVVATK